MPKYSPFLYAGLMGTVLIAPNAHSSESADIKQFKRLLAQQSKQLQAQQQVLDAQTRQLNELQSRLDVLSGDKPIQTATNPPQKSEPAPKSATSQQPASAQPAAGKPQQQTASVQPRLKEMPKDTRPPEIPRVSADVGGVLTPKGRIVIEPSVQYSYSKSQRIAIGGYTVAPVLIGNIDVRDVKRETETASLTGRYGITDRIEVEARVPYLRREDSSQTRETLGPNTNDRLFNADGMDIGDIEVAGHYQFNNGQNGWPFLIGNLRVKTDTGTSPFDMPIDLKFNIPTKLNTGTGFWSFQPSLTAIFPSDPAVFYGNVSYLWNVERNIAERIFTVPTGEGSKILVKSGGTIDPGDAIGFSFGSSLAYNEKASFSLGYSHTIYFKTSQNGERLDGSDFDVGQFTFGLNYAFSKKTSANLAVAIGATRDAPDVQMTLRIPFGIDLL
ncbi:MAG: transporter [Methylococcales bacterium]